MGAFDLSSYLWPDVAQGRQPQGPVRIDWSNPILSGLVGLLTGAVTGGGQDLVTGAMYPNKVGPVVSPSGFSYGNSVVDGGGGVWSNRIGTDPNVNWRPVSPVLSYAVAFHFFANSGTRPIASVGYGAGGHGFWITTVLSDGTLSGTIITSGGTNQLFGATGDIKVGALNVAVFTCDGSKVYLHINGRRLADQPNFVGGTLSAYGATFCRTALITNPDAAGAAASGHWKALWNRALSLSEIKALSDNPWQIFAPPSIPFLIAAGNAPQLLAPISDIAAGLWTPSSDTDLYAMLGESTASAADYIVTSTPSSCEVRLAVGGDPAVSTGHILRYQLLAGTGSITVALKQGSTTIASWGPHALDGSDHTFEQTLTGGQADAISDYGDLRVAFTAS